MSAPAPSGTGRLAGRVAVVTGASRGIGLAVARRLVDEGARVTVTARRPEALDEAAAALNAGRPEPVALAVAGRADDAAHRADALDRTVAAFGRIDALVNNTGINPTYGPLVDVARDAAAKTFAVNVTSALEWTHDALARGLGAGGGPGAPTGAVVNVASVAGLRPAAGIALYGASKAALLSATAALAVELAPAVRVNAVAPAVVRTRFATALFEGREAEVAAGYPLGRLGEPEDVAAAVAFLLSDDASWVTGQTLVLDGGLLGAGGV